MGVFLIIVIIAIPIVYIIKNKVRINWGSFFHRGFKKTDNKFGLIVFDGKQGCGKTYSSVRFCIDQKLHSDYIILTNVHSFKTFSDTIFCDDIFKIMQLSIDMGNKGIKHMIFFDEIFTILQKGGSLQIEILSFLSQLRKRKILFVTTAQEWAEINITFRRYCRYEVACNMIALPLSKTAIVINHINDGYQMKWDNDLQEFIAPPIQLNISKGNKSIIQQYDTFETIKVGRSANTFRK